MLKTNEKIVPAKKQKVPTKKWEIYSRYKMGSFRIENTITAIRKT